MVAPRGSPRYRVHTERSVPDRTTAPGAPKGKEERGYSFLFRRLGRTLLVVLLPLALMLGSVYAHTTAAELEREAARLEEEEKRAEGEGERLEVRVTELSEPGRVRALAREKLGMRDPGEDLATYDGEDVADGGEEKRGARE